jgi:hypothetical protein|eukprot:COSAG01_NODE_574_length_15291_cov_18.398368_5_plen_1699_part_00
MSTSTGLVALQPQLYSLQRAVQYSKALLLFDTANHFGDSHAVPVLTRHSHAPLLTTAVPVLLAIHLPTETQAPLLFNMMLLSGGLAALMLYTVNAQTLAPLASPGSLAGGCDLQTLDLRLIRLNDVCCVAQPGRPAPACATAGIQNCSIDCAKLVVPLVHDCGQLLNAIYDGANGAENGVAELINNVYTPCAAIPPNLVLDHVSDLIDDGICSLEDANGWGQATVDPPCVDALGTTQCATVQASGISCRSLRGQCDQTCHFCRVTPGGGGGRFLMERRLQTPLDQSCNTAQLQANYARIDTVCCDDTGGVCASGVPTSCDAKCAVFFVDLWDRCHTQLTATAGPTASTQLTSLYSTCTTALPTEQLLQLAAVCEGGFGGTGACQVKATTASQGNNFVIFWVNTQSTDVVFYQRSSPTASWRRVIGRVVHTGTGPWTTHSGSIRRGHVNYEYAVCIDGNPGRGACPAANLLGPWSEPGALLGPTHLNDAACVLTQTTPDAYTNVAGHYCRTTERTPSGTGNGSPLRPGVYTSLATAEAACTADSTCHSVYDDRCDGTGTFYTCSSAVGATSSIGSCLAVKSSRAQVITPPAPWLKVVNTYCSAAQQTTTTGTTTHPHFDSRMEAEAACLADPTCLSVYDASCNGRGTWYTCTVDGTATSPGTPSQIGSCLYVKGTNSVASGGILPYGVGGNCDVHTLATRIASLNHACCLGEPGGTCRTGICSVDCGVALLPLLDECRPLLDAIYDDVDSVQDGTAQVFDTLQGRCQHLDGHPLDALSRLVDLHNQGKCADEVLNGVGEMHVTTCADSNANCASLQATGLPCSNLVGQCDQSCNFCVATGTGRRLATESEEPAQRRRAQGGTTTIHVINARTHLCGESTFDTAWSTAATAWASSQTPPVSVQAGTCLSAGYTHRTGQTQQLPGTGAPANPTITFFSQATCDLAQFPTLMNSVPTVCCDSQPYPPPNCVPTTCDAKCAVLVVPLYENCTTQAATLQPLYQVCTQSMTQNVDDLLLKAAECSAPAPPTPPAPTPGYVLRADHYCGSRTTHPNLAAAMAACNASSTCLSVSDPNCDGSGTYYTCTTATGTTSQSGSCMYIKDGTPGASAPPPPPGYTLVPSKYCTGQGSYGTLAAAGRACDRSATCTALYDGSCDGTGTFYTCGAVPTAGYPSSTAGSCLYTKNGGASPPPPPSAPGYTQLTNHYCTGTTNYATLAAAQAACSADTTCLAVDDGSCDGAGQFQTCTTSTGSASRAGSCMYVKTTGGPAVTNDCTPAAIDLATLTSPHQDTTVGRGSGYTAPLGSGPQIVFVVTMAPGAHIDIGQSVNNFDSEVTVAYGGACPGQTRIQAWDDPDTRRVTWTNSESTPQILFFVIDGYAGRSGTFTLTWTITGNAPAPPPSSTLYTQRPTHYCDNAHEISNFPSLAAAEAACSRSSSCRSVEDESCDGTGTFNTCSTATGSPSGVGTCLYVKALAAAAYRNYSDHYCSGADYVTGSTTYTTVATAEAACTASAACHSVYDDRCDGTGTFHLCSSATGTASRIHSCLLVKNGAGGPSPPPLTPPPPRPGTHYSLTPNHYCATASTITSTVPLTSLHAAETACTANPACLGVYDDSCNDQGTFRMCSANSGTGMPSSSIGSCMYNKGRATACCSTHAGQCGCSATSKGGCHTDICACGRGVCGQVGSATVTSSSARYPYICDTTC